MFFFSGAEESGLSLEQVKKYNNLNKIGLKKKATVACGCGGDEKEKSEREREKVLILFSSVSTGHSAGPCAIFSAASSHAAEDDNYLIVLAGVSVKVVVR